MIVIDVGSATHGEGPSSTKRLEDCFAPDHTLAFDALTGLAAWTYDGHLGVVVNGSSTRVFEGGAAVACVDLARVISDLPDEPIVLKIDAEGAEYALLPRLIETGMHYRLSLLLVEWHDPQDQRASIEEQLSCPVLEWRW